MENHTRLHQQVHRLVTRYSTVVRSHHPSNYDKLKSSSVKTQFISVMECNQVHSVQYNLDALYL